jgi:alpha-methylacyl-CoA racemase
MTDALRGTLDGFHVVAVVSNVPGPLAAARLRALDARVTKIEPAGGDALATWSPGWYASITGGMEVLRIDLRLHAGAATLDALLQDADVLLSSVRARTLERLALDRRHLPARYPRLSHVAICGEAPPNNDRVGHDLTYQARAGLVAPPAMPRTLVADLAAAERAVQATLGALLRRERSGEPSHVDVSVTDAAMAFSQPYTVGLTRPDGELGGGLPQYNIYPSANGWIAVAALEPHFVEHLRAMLGLHQLSSQTLRDAFRGRTSEEWETVAEQHDVPLCAIRT